MISKTHTVGELAWEVPEVAYAWQKRPGRVRCYYVGALSTKHCYRAFRPASEAPRPCHLSATAREIRFLMHGTSVVSHPYPEGFFSPHKH